MTDRNSTLRHVALCGLLLLAAIHLGINVGVNFLAAPVPFAFVENGVRDSAVAREMAGTFFSRAHRVAFVLLPLAVISALLARPFTARIQKVAILGGLTLLVALLLVETLYITPEIRRLRESLGVQYGTVSAAPRDDPERARFGMLHGLSMMRALVDALLAFAVFVAGAAALRRP